MNTKGKIDFTKTDNIQFIEEVAREIRLHGSCETHARHMHRLSILAD